MMHFEWEMMIISGRNQLTLNDDDDDEQKCLNGHNDDDYLKSFILDFFFSWQNEFLENFESFFKKKSKN